VSGEMLRQLLKLPETAQIVGSVLARSPHVIALVVESPDFSAIPEGASRVVHPRYRNDAHGEAEFIDWGLA
jgi:hypothetical protein